MQSGTFISLLAKSYAVDEKTVGLYARNLKEAGYLTTGARGVNAPHMIPLDAARVTIALLATDSPSKAVTRLQRFSQMTIDESRSTKSANQPLIAGDRVVFEQVLTRLFSSDPEENYFHCAPFIEIDENAKTAALEVGADRFVFADKDRSEALLKADSAELFGIRRTRGLASIDLMNVWVALWGDKFRGSDANGYPLDLSHPWNTELKGKAYSDRVQEVIDEVKSRYPDWKRGC